MPLKTKLWMVFAIKIPTIIIEIALLIAGMTFGHALDSGGIPTPNLPPHRAGIQYQSVLVMTASGPKPGSPVCRACLLRCGAYRRACRPLDPPSSANPSSLAHP